MADYFCLDFELNAVLKEEVWRRRLRCLVMRLTLRANVNSFFKQHFLLRRRRGVLINVFFIVMWRLRRVRPFNSSGLPYSLPLYFAFFLK